MPLPIREALKPLFEPESVAIIGASNVPTKWGYRMITRPIQSGYQYGHVWGYGRSGL